MRMRFAGEDQLHRPLVSFRIRASRSMSRKDQRRPLVGGEAARKADGQRIGIEHLVRSFDLRLRRAPAYAS